MVLIVVKREIENEHEILLICIVGFGIKDIRRY